MNQTAHNRSMLFAAIASALAFFALLQVLALRYTGGVFDYPLDDVYIHLAMSEGLKNGTYGINAGEPASAASSVLYPLLLWPFASPEIQRLMPLFWNVVGLCLSTWLWVKLLLTAGFGAPDRRPLGLALAIGGPVMLQMSSTAFLGMEHSLHAVTSLAILYALVRHFQGETPWGLLFVAILFSPILRYEGLSLALLAAAVLALGRHWVGAGVALLLALVPLALFSAFLTSQGLDPLPNSVLAKQLGIESDLTGITKIVAKFRHNISTGSGIILLGYVLAVFALFLTVDDIRQGRYRTLALVLIVAGMGHLFFGQIGWMNRYEHYILLVLVAGILVLLASLRDRISRALMTLAALVTVTIPGIWYLPEVVTDFPVNVRAIQTQQGQMADFAKNHLNAPVAVNDIGWVTWNNPHYVLDLWGLASAPALKLRLANAEPGWAGPLTDKYDVGVAMIYDDWLQEAVGPNWVPLGSFTLTERRGFLGDATVRFYATSPEAEEPARSALQTWVPGLHPLTVFTFEDGSQ